jgi:hypothetical protein
MKPLSGEKLTEVTLASGVSCLGQLENTVNEFICTCRIFTESRISNRHSPQLTLRLGVFYVQDGGHYQSLGSTQPATGRRG